MRYVYIKLTLLGQASCSSTQLAYIYKVSSYEIERSPDIYGR